MRGGDVCWREHVPKCWLVMWWTQNPNTTICVYNLVPRASPPSNPKRPSERGYLRLATAGQLACDQARLFLLFRKGLIAGYRATSLRRSALQGTGEMKALPLPSPLEGRGTQATGQLTICARFATPAWPSPHQQKVKIWPVVGNVWCWRNYHWKCYPGCIRQSGILSLINIISFTRHLHTAVNDCHAKFHFVQINNMNQTLNFSFTQPTIKRDLHVL